MNEDNDFSAQPIQKGFTKNADPRVIKIEEDHPWDGLLVVMNGDQLHLFNKNYMDVLREIIGKAYANNHAVIYVSDPIEGPIPEELDFLEERCFQRMPNFVGRQDLNFSPIPKIRMQEFKSMVLAIRSRQDMRFIGKGVMFAGSCKIAGQQTLIPPISVS